ncbi:fibroblast growth factor 4A-like [Aplochiton taeniatus]
MDGKALTHLLLLAAGLCGHLAGAGAGLRPEDRGSQLFQLWRLSMRDSKLTGNDASPHPIRGLLKEQLLYCRAGIGYHLQILPNSTVRGVHKPTEHCLLKLSAMKPGVVGIRGVRSGLYLCMSLQGVIHGAETFSDDCLFRETLEENHYTTYSSLSQVGYYLALTHKGEAKRGNAMTRHQPCTHFLPRRAV